MSDYLFSSLPQEEGSLSQLVQDIYDIATPKMQEFHGEWGALAVSQGHYHGFKPYETEQHIFIIIGGPVLYFRDNDFLVEDDSDTASKAVYERWIIESNIQWDEDLSGPFTILLVDKSDSTLQVVTDLMAFIPVYACEKETSIFIGTHIDALAKCSGEIHNLDQVSLADFILNDVITYPYTAYENLKQLAPSSTTIFKNKQKVSADAYWEPVEHNKYRSITEAAIELRNGMQGYVNRITDKMDHVGQFISGGEDSRVLSGILSPKLKRDGYIFLDRLNREGKVAEKVAELYNVKLKIGIRTKTHYLDILPPASRLIGTGHQYFHAHSLRFDKQYNLASYSAVFGGYLADSLLKGAFARKVKGTRYLPFLPEISRVGDTKTQTIKSNLFQGRVLDEMTERRRKHYSHIANLRPYSANEWFALRPASMRVAIPNLFTTRRLFKSYEPFMCKEAVKISASVPVKWKLNRRLFNCAMKPFLVKSKRLPHADGRLPYYSWWVNIPLQTSVWLYRKVATRLGIIKGNQGPWGDWNELFKSESWHEQVVAWTKSTHYLGLVDKDLNSVTKLIFSNSLSTTQKLNLVQVLNSVSVHEKDN